MNGLICMKTSENITKHKYPTDKVKWALLIMLTVVVVSIATAAQRRERMLADREEALGILLQQAVENKFAEVEGGKFVWNTNVADFLEKTYKLHYEAEEKYRSAIRMRQVSVALANLSMRVIDLVGE